jgi:YegS/Rv2252/BmrU family lipid kinase
VATCVIFNPFAQGEKATRFRAFLEKLKGDCAIRGTTGPGAARTLARDAMEEGFETIVAAGGDGTINEVVNGIAEAKEGFARARLGVLPVGTVNVFARELGLPLRIHRAWDTLECGREISIDLPAIDFTEGGAPRRRYFVQMAGAGLDALAVETVDWKLKKRIGRYAYIVSMLKALRSGLPVVTASSPRQSASGELILLGNGRYYGGAFALFRKASFQDGLLDVCVIPKVTPNEVFRYAWAYVVQRDIVSRDEHYFQTDSLQLAAPKRTPFELDGENVGCLPAAISIRRQVLRIVVGPSHPALSRCSVAGV